MHTWMNGRLIDPYLSKESSKLLPMEPPDTSSLCRDGFIAPSKSHTGTRWNKKTEGGRPLAVQDKQRSGRQTGMSERRVVQQRNTHRSLSLSLSNDLLNPLESSDGIS